VRRKTSAEASWHEHERNHEKRKKIKMKRHVAGAMRSVTTKKEDRKQGRGEGTDVCKETEKRFVRRLQRTRETRQKKKGPVEKKKSCITTFLSFFFKKNKKKSPGLVNFQAGWRGARTVFKSSIPSTVAQEKGDSGGRCSSSPKKIKKFAQHLGRVLSKWPKS